MHLIFMPGQVPEPITAGVSAGTAVQHHLCGFLLGWSHAGCTHHLLLCGEEEEEQWTAMSLPSVSQYDELGTGPVKSLRR